VFQFVRPRAIPIGDNFGAPTLLTTVVFPLPPMGFKKLQDWARTAMGCNIIPTKIAVKQVVNNDCIKYTVLKSGFWWWSFSIAWLKEHKYGSRNND
jgi:hypothetical protein